MLSTANQPNENQQDDLTQGDLLQRDMCLTPKEFRPIKQVKILNNAR